MTQDSRVETLQRTRKAYLANFESMVSQAKEDISTKKLLTELVINESVCLIRWLHVQLDIPQSEVAEYLELFFMKETPSDLHTMPYADYLLTMHWKKMRQNALERAGHCCQICNTSEHLNVHHRTYKRRGYEREADLIVLCQNCHQIFHENGKLEVES